MRVCGSRRSLPFLCMAILGLACAGDGGSVVDERAGTSTSAPGRPTTTSTDVRAVVAYGFPAQPQGVPYPTEEWPQAPWPAGVDKAAVDAATDAALAGGADERVRATIVIHRGQLVYERYSPNVEDGPDFVMPSFSIAKSITSAMIGVLVRDGILDVDEPAPVPEWDGDDDRAAITVEHLLQMGSGLEWVDGTEPGSNLATMFGRDDAAGYVATRPLAHTPGSVFSYNTGGTVLLAKMLADDAGPGEELRAFVDRELFAKLGMAPVEMDFDRAGTWLGGWSADTTARDFAKFGLLYARGGQWDGEQILPQEWVEYTRTPSPANAEYGAQWWLDPQRPEVMYAVGAKGQVITVDPAHDLVIVQLSTVGGQLPLAQTEVILDAFAAADS